MSTVANEYSVFSKSMGISAPAAHVGVIRTRLTTDLRSVLIEEQGQSRATRLHAWPGIWRHLRH